MHSVDPTDSEVPASLRFIMRVGATKLGEFGDWASYVTGPSCVLKVTLYLTNEFPYFTTALDILEA